jgi:uncharacterized protein YjgD (DUF1641 family)
MYTVEEIIQNFDEEKTKLEQKLDNTVMKIHKELEQLDFVINLLKQVQEKGTLDERNG